MLVFFFIARIFDGVDSALLADANGNYFSYVLIGMVSAYLLNSAMNAMTNDIRSGQTLGTLETILASPMRIIHYLIASGLYSFFTAITRIVGLLIIAGFFLGVDFSNANLLAAFTIIMTTMLCFSGLGVLSAAFILVFKKGNPVSLIIQSSFTLLGGVIFPISVLPQGLHGIAQWIPMTYVTSGLREALLQGAGFAELQSRFIALGTTTILVFPIALMTFSWALSRAKHHGTLGQH